MSTFQSPVVLVNVRRMTDDGLSPGDLLAGRYRLIDRLGSGGMAVIWRAHDETLERLVAVKVLDLTLAGDARMRDLVRREAWATARLNHPDVAGVHDFVQLGDFGVLVMQLVQGEPVADLIAAGPLPWRDAVRIGHGVAAVLDHVHHRGVVHRDITPDNVIISADKVTVLDFGIAARIGEPDEDSTGASFGTPAYVAPERLDGTPAQTATDIYALGVVLFEMLTGKVPFAVRGWDDVAFDHGPPPLLGVQGLPTPVRDLVPKMLSRVPGERPRAEEVAAVLDEALQPKRSHARLALALAAIAAAAAVIWWPRDTPPTLPNADPTPTVSTFLPTRDAALHAVMSVISDGVATGQIRPDAALDLQQVLRVAQSQSQLDGVLVKIADREREGAISPASARTLRAALDTLAATMRSSA
ncbi:MAG TPA: serine/threonine protein kinase [Micromonosporaceae bacterium]|nr:serine/threonine protein kinase [Micromonosporaceae bacterium]